jgi:hypothetical protein
MPSTNQTTIEATVTARALGSSSTFTLAAAFGTSPIHEKSDEFASVSDLKAHYEKLALDGLVINGFGFPTFNRDFVDAPEGAEETGAGGWPASNWVPNPASPGEGNGMNATDLPAPPAGFGQGTPSQWGSGEGSQLSPKASSEAISMQKLSHLTLGKATPRS